MAQFLERTQYQLGSTNIIHQSPVIQSQCPLIQSIIHRSKTSDHCSKAIHHCTNTIVHCTNHPVGCKSTGARKMSTTAQATGTTTEAIGQKLASARKLGTGAKKEKRHQAEALSKHGVGHRQGLNLWLGKPTKPLFHNTN